MMKMIIFLLLMKSIVVILSKIFGELFMLIEKDKRGIELQLLYSDENFCCTCKCVYHWYDEYC